MFEFITIFYFHFLQYCVLKNCLFKLLIYKLHYYSCWFEMINNKYNNYKLTLYIIFFFFLYLPAFFLSDSFLFPIINNSYHFVCDFSYSNNIFYFAFNGYQYTFKQMIWCLYFSAFTFRIIYYSHFYKLSLVLSTCVHRRLRVFHIVHGRLCPTGKNSVGTSQIVSTFLPFFNLIYQRVPFTGDVVYMKYFLDFSLLCVWFTL